MPKRADSGRPSENGFSDGLYRYPAQTRVRRCATHPAQIPHSTRSLPFHTEPAAVPLP
ncbi:hypothetical protein [Kingella potus]|uniref:hypothetical protein n=1 Tax=Kingella potus TaxID=265175 RepID=UPI001FD31109|nr:hypothetical protein [Kingella potus]UOP00940.1 hypothetical protein LVJ84_00535 [Kingella potus]